MGQTEEVMDMVTTYFKLIEGRTKTVIDASVTDERQADAAKSLAAQLMWSTWDDIKAAVAKIVEPEQAE